VTAELVGEILYVTETWSFDTVLTKAHYWTLSWAAWIHYTSSSQIVLQGSATGSQRICGYISVVATLMFPYF